MLMIGESSWIVFLCGFKCVLGLYLYQTLTMIASFLYVNTYLKVKKIISNLQISVIYYNININNEFCSLREVITSNAAPAFTADSMFLLCT